MNDLTQALTARTDARQRHQEAAAALERARQVHKDAEAEMARLAGEETRWIERHSRRLADWIAGGNKGTQPLLAADAKAQQALSSARAAAAAAAAALKGFEAAFTEVHENLAANVAAVDRAAREVLVAEGDELARRIVARDLETWTMRQQLLALRELGIAPTEAVRDAIFDPLNTPLPELQQRFSGLGRRDPMHVPVSELRKREMGQDSASRDAASHWRQRLDALLKGADLPPSPAPEQERAA